MMVPANFAAFWQHEYMVKILFSGDIFIDVAYKESQTYLLVYQFNFDQPNMSF